MRLKGSCQCGKVRFEVASETPYPFMYCYCTICRKTTGGPYGVNIMGSRESLRIRGRKHLRCYHAVMREPGKRAQKSPGERWFCGACGTHLFVADRRWPAGVWPNAGAIDTPLPESPEVVHIMLRYKPAWVQATGKGPRYPHYPVLSIAQWHEQHHLTRRRTQAARRRRMKARAS